MYTREEYEAQFSIRIANYLAKYDRMEAQFKVEEGMPEEFWNCLNDRRAELLALKNQFDKDIVSPFEL